MIAAFDYASPSFFDSDREQSQLGMSANARRPVRFHGRVLRNLPLLRFGLRALGEAIWSNDRWASQGEYMSWTLDPVITVHPDRIFFEAFSQDQSVYAMVILNPEMFSTEGELQTGTTNVDFTAWLWGALNELRSSRETWLRIGSEGFEVRTKNAGGRFQQKVELPDPWVRGFLEVSAAMAMPGTRLSVRPADLLRAIRFLRYTKAKLSPRALRYEFPPGEEARIVLEPWEEVVPLRGAEHNYTEHRVIRTWGRRRLNLIEPLLPFADEVSIFLKGRGLPSFYAVKMPDITFVLGLSGWTENAWSENSSFDLLQDRTAVSPELLARVREQLAAKFQASPRQLAELLGQPEPVIWKACEKLSRQGLAIFDVEERGFRHRQLFEDPVDEAKLFPPDERVDRARELVAKKAVAFARCEAQETRKVKKLKTPEGPLVREIVYRDWRVNGNVAAEKTEIVVADSGKIIFGTCSCSFFQENLLGRGPCEHMLALYQTTTEARKDLPTSGPAVAGADVTPPSRTSRDDEEADESEEEEKELSDDPEQDSEEGEERDDR